MTRTDLQLLLDRYAEGSGPSKYVRGTGKDVLEWFRPFANTILSHVHEFSTDKRVILVTVCSYAKPYSMSWLHYGMNQELWMRNLLGDVEKWHLSSAGMIPSSLETEVPFVCYDWNNEEALPEELEALREVLRDYFVRWLQLYAYGTNKPIVTYFREGSNTQQAIDSVFAGATRVTRVCPVRAKSVSVPATQLPLGLTCGGLYSDPDGCLLLEANLDSLCKAIQSLLGE